MSDLDPWSRRLAEARSAPRPVAASVTLLIPTLGRHVISDCLGAVLAGTCWPGAVTVVDQGPSPRIAGMLRELDRIGIVGRHEICAGSGRALGLNVGLRLVRTPFVVITDDDCVPGPHWIATYAGHLASEPEAVFTGRVLAAGEERVMSTVSHMQRTVAQKPGVVFDRLSGGNCGMAREILERTGLFDEDPCVRHAEDGEWAYRALRAGVPIIYSPDLVVAHVGWRNLEERLAQYRDYARSQGAFYGKHLKRGDLFMVLRTTVHLARAMRRWLKGVLHRDRDVAAIGRSYATQLVPGMIMGLRSSILPPSLRCSPTPGPSTD